MLSIDHVVLGVRDLDATSDRMLAELGLASVVGGHHPAWGTANRVIPLGGDYVELLSVIDRETAAGSRFGRFMLDLTAEGDRWFTACLGDDDLTGTAARLGLEVVSGSRTLPDGSEVRWRSAGLDDPKRDSWLPFFIAWEDPENHHPGRMGTDPPGPRGRIAWVEMGGDPQRVEGWLGSDNGLPIRMVAGDPGIVSVGIALDGGTEIVL